MGAANTLSTALLMGLSSLGCGGCSAQADSFELRVTRQEVIFPGTPRQATTDGIDTSAAAAAASQTEAGQLAAAALQGEEVERTESFEQDQELEVPNGLDSALWPLWAKLVPHEGTTADLSFLNEFDLTIRCASGELPDQLLLTYSRDGTPSASTEAMATAEERTNIIDYWNCAQAFYDVHVVGILPEEDWAVDVVIELGGEFKLAL